MVKHIIVWKFKDEVENKAARAKEIKTALEGLVGVIDGLLEMHIHIDPLASSSGDVSMDSTFESEAALNAYSIHPAHVAVADGLVRPSMQARLSFDFEVK